MKNRKKSLLKNNIIDYNQYKIEQIIKDNIKLFGENREFYLPMIDIMVKNNYTLRQIEIELFGYMDIRETFKRMNK